MMRLFFFDDAQHGIDQKQKQNPARGQLRQLQQRAVGTRARSKRPRAHTDACLVNTHTHEKKMLIRWQPKPLWRLVGPHLWSPS